jgi:hypothetical protein
MIGRETGFSNPVKETEAPKERSGGTCGFLTG